MPEYASAGSRIVAVIIDHIILWVVMIILAMPFGLSAFLFNYVISVSSAMTMFSNIAALGSIVLLNIVLFLLYFSYFEGTTGQTPGKKAMGIKVVKYGKGKVTFADAFVRTLLRIIDGVGAYILGLIVILVSDRKQRIGDMTAKTVVVKA